MRPPALLERETWRTRGMMRDIISDKVESLLVDCKGLRNGRVQDREEIGLDRRERVASGRDESER